MAAGTRVSEAFLRWGWLLPLTLPVVQLAGRAPANVVGGVYVLWGLWTLAAVRPRLPRAPVLLYLAVLAAFAASAAGAEDPLRVARKLFKFAAHTSVFPFTLMALAAGASVRRLGRTAAAWGLASLAALYVLLPFALARPDYDPTHHLQEDELPFVAPFLLAGALALRTRMGARRAAAAGLSVLVLVAAYVMLSEGRAALAGLVVGVGVWTMAALRWRSRALLAGLALIAVAAAVGGPRFYRHADQIAAQGWFAVLDQLSSRRMTIWRRAIEQPPARALTGVGLGNPKRLGTLDDVADGWRIEALHNVFMDAWYETGLLGLAALAAFVLAGLVRLGLALREADPGLRPWLGACLAGALAVLTAAQLGISITSRPFSVYLFLVLAAGWVSSRAGPRTA